METGFLFPSKPRAPTPPPLTMPKWVKSFIGILLLPLCVGATRALILVMRASGSADTVWVAMLAGAACWLVVLLLLPRPMWVYVFGHELTHALWTWLFGGRVKRFKASAQGGHVVVTKTNFLITLAPYFFPLYVAIVILVFMTGHLIWNWTRYLVWFHLLTGAAYAFHITLTCHALRTSQSDITRQGYFFSAIVIWLGNVVILLLGVPLVTSRIGLFTALGWCIEATIEALHQLGRLL